jgi:hypothetical protein
MPWALYLPSAELADAVRSDLVNPEKVQIRETDEWAVPRLQHAPALAPQKLARSGLSHAR